MLTDHYNPSDKTVNLSEVVYDSASVAAAAVAAHECGHAVQHAAHYPMLALRSNLVPVVQFGSNLAPIVLMIGLGLAYAGHNLTVLLAGIALFAASTIFAFVTLPVEIRCQPARARLAGSQRRRHRRLPRPREERALLGCDDLRSRSTRLAGAASLLHHAIHARARSPLKKFT
jgi:Zn-dependent membrane protease YugP